MKCVIVTFHNVYNFGAVLQAYSLKSYLENRGHTVVFADLRTQKIKEGYRLNPFRRPVGLRTICRRMIRELPFQLPQALAFEGFARRHMGKTIGGDKKSIEKYRPDIVIVGSDQVWNNVLTGNTDVYYLPRLDKRVKKISYAASFGKKGLTAYQKKCIKENMGSFDLISLREDNGIREIGQLASKEARVVLDPVFLGDKKFWSELSDSSAVRPEGDYILIYSLAFDTGAVKTAKRIAAKLKLPVMIIHPTGARQPFRGKQLYNVGPCEFLYLIRNAALVITDSFHGTAFSLIFGKKICCTRDMNDPRISSLMSRIDLPESCMTDICGARVFDFSRSETGGLTQIIRESESFLDSALK